MRISLPALVGALVCVHASMASTRVAACLYVLQQDHPAWAVGVLLSLFAVAPLGLSLWAGRLADRHGLHRPLAVGALMAASGAVIACATQHLAALMVAALATGGGLSIVAVAVQREAGHSAEGLRELKRIYSWVSLGPASSNAISPVIVGLLIDHVGFRSAFAFAAVLPLLAWGLGTRLPRLNLSNSADDADVGSGAWQLLRLPALRHLLLMNVILSACWDAHALVVPVLGHARSLSASEIGAVLGSFAIAATAVRLAMSRYAGGIDERRSLQASMTLATLACATYAVLPGLGGMMLASAMLGVGLGSVQPMVLSLLHQLAPPSQRGQALGLRMLCTNGATIVMPLMFGVLVQWTVPAAPMWLMAGVILIAQWSATHINAQATAAAP